MVPFLILFLTTKVSPQDVFAVGLLPFVASAAAGFTKIMIQAYRFKYFIKNFIGYDVSSTGKTVAARLAGEFVTQTTPSYVGGEFVRIAWLSKNGVAPGKAAWVTTMEIIADVFVGSMLAFIAGGLAIYRGGNIVGIAVILITIPTFGVWLALLLFSAKRNLRLPSIAQRIIERFVAKEKAGSMVNSANAAITDLCKMSRENFNSPRALKTFSIGMAITFVAFVFQGASFMILANAVESDIGLFDSLMAISASTALANLPITIGGSGLAELGIWAYLSNLNGLPTLETLASDSQLNVIIAWRIATYHVPLVFMWIALMKLAVGKVPTRGVSMSGGQNGSGSGARSPNDSDGSNEKK